MGDETHGLTNQPVFLNPALRDYYLPASSPLIDKGVPIPGINDDWIGTAPDLGAIEHGMVAERLSQGPDGLTIGWRVGALGYFQLQSAADLTQPHWTAFGAPLQARRPWLQILVPIATNNGRFFRLQHVAP